MASQNLYLAYKRDTSRLIYWIIKASNTIIASEPTLLDKVPKSPNTNGQVTVAGLVSLSKLIAKHIDPIPSTILALFNSVIQARTAAYGIFQQLVANKSDPEVERSNVSHKHFIDALVEAFEVLGGNAWAEECKSEDPLPDNQADLDQILFTNKFAGLRVDEDTVLGDQGTSDDGSDLEHQQHHASQRRQQQKKSSGKGKKTQSGKNANKKKRKTRTKTTQQQSTAASQSLDDVPIESYRIIQDKEGIMTDYLMAVYALVKDWASLRAYLQGLWHDVAYNGLNSAVAGAVSNLAINMIECSASAMFIDFPGHESYETVMNTITRGNSDKAQGGFTIALHQISPDQTNTRKVRETAIDVKEQFLIYAYRDLIDFVTDFQKTRSGKPTKHMLSEISGWDPNLDLQRASDIERLKWRRSYTINWLYDLVNLFSAIVVQRNTMRGEHHRLELVNWSTTGPWDKHRRLYGLNEFAGIVTHLAMQKSGSDIRHKILPHHIFQLQCIVDSFSVSRGWSLSGLRGHILRAPAQGFRSRRDVDLFLDRENKRTGSGFLQAVDILRQLFQKDGILHGDLKRHEANYQLLEAVQYDFINWLGESKYMSGLTNIAPSRFTTTNSNGLWEYSPFLCGVGLEEGLREAYQYSFVVLDTLPEPVLLIHLHNMLVQKGYIAKPVGLFASFQDLFTTAFFTNGRVPTSNFGEALLERVAELRTRRPRVRRTVDDVKELRNNQFFKTKSYLMACYAAGWNPDRIPDSDIPMPSLLGVYRISQAKHITDPATGKKRLEDTYLVKLARARGISEEDLMAYDMTPPSEIRTEQPIPEALRKAMVPEGYTVGSLPGIRGMGGKLELSGPDLLALFKVDISNDICGDVPLSSLNYVSTMARFMVLFMQFESELDKLRNPLYVQAYETDRQWQKHKRVGLAYLALHLQDEECLRVMAHEFQNPRAGFMNHIYWEDLESTIRCGQQPSLKRTSGAFHDQCTVM
ncbi:hypothetical protein F5B22DRAFT_470697 [Xylaria bambusicola]|uniref:uncharacterized protein n=1 Tax=Xylaria bambusicola TaxID=326684 RepID=UPI0020080356|nr:uncharacterized protein F5B22DRAFT_470697 [Xylaria bambusicola]KAI0506199.1 hypothetical protein F5B22DRAFT_470697 [Xylaria bambusicola]